MPYAEVFLSQLTDPFRIGLLVVLAITAFNTAAHTGLVLPLVLGAVFVAVLIPTTLGDGGGDWMIPTAVGLVSNALILAIVVAIRLMFSRVKGPEQDR
jgi:hypothetical protein